MQRCLNVERVGSSKRTVGCAVGRPVGAYKSPDPSVSRMFPKRNVGGRDRLVRGLLAGLFVVVAAGALTSGRRTVGAVAAAAAAGLGFNAVTCFCGLNEALGVDTTRD